MSSGDVHRNFFTDLHGLQKITQKQIQYCPEKHNYGRLQNFFKYHIKEGGGITYILQMERIRLIFSEYLGEIESSEFRDELSIRCVMIAIKDFHENNKGLKGILRKLPQKQLSTVKNDLEEVSEHIPSDFFCSNSIEMSEKRFSKKSKIPPLNFYIPMLENHPIIEEDEFAFPIEKFTPQSSTFALIPKTNGYFDLREAYEKNSGQLFEFPFDEFREILQVNFASDKTDEEILNNLLDTFGCEVFELLNKLIENRYRIQWDEKIVKKAPSVRPTNKNAPSISSQVIVQSKEEKFMAKTLRKIEKKQKNNGDDIDYKNDVEYGLNVLQTQSIFKRSAPSVDKISLPHVHDQMRENTIITKLNGTTIKQPENTIKRETNIYVEFTMPGQLSANKSGNIENIELIDASTLDSIGKVVFRDLKRFNRVQSEVFPTAYNTNENMLICAPTGAGKTNIALLSIVQQIRAHMENGVIRRDDFKIVYVCPMKALATEMVANFSKKLGPIGIVVKEITGDMHLTKKEIAETQMLVTTPEKWDVISRKGAVDTEVTGRLRLLILDEVHLLNTDRGPVIEALVARTLRQVLATQTVIRIVALSATLPGYLDVAHFLKVNPRTGLFFFDNRFRSVPLSMTFIGVRNPKLMKDANTLDEICYHKIEPLVREGHQAMVFVTSRNMCGQVARNLLEFVRAAGKLALFTGVVGGDDDEDGGRGGGKLVALKSTFKSADLEMLVQNGFGIHHAGMCRPDRLEIESLFRKGALKVIVCTTTLAWGVNLPAHAVIIRGTTRYDAQKSKFVNMDMLDVMQIFGRAGRPQYDTTGHGMILTDINEMTNYMSMVTSQVPIESQFLNFVPDNLNAEVVLGTVSNIKEAMEWLSNTFVYTRIKNNPLNYGLTFTDVWNSEKLSMHLQRQLFDAATLLDQAKIVRFTRDLGELRPTNYGRIASFYYISHQTMKYFQKHFTQSLNEADLLKLISNAYEFVNMQVRNDELDELERLDRVYTQYVFNNLDKTSIPYKVLVLIQANISRAKIFVSSLVSDTEFIMQTVTRLSRALFEIAGDMGYANQLYRCLIVAQMVEQQCWPDQHPLMQYRQISGALSQRAEEALQALSIDEIQEMNESEILNLVRQKSLAQRVRHYVQTIPRLNLDVIVKPITEGVISLRLMINAAFVWDNSVHGSVQHYYAWAEDSSRDVCHHFESFVVTKRNLVNDETIELIFTVPLLRPLSDEYYVVVANSKFMNTLSTFRIDLEKLKMVPSQSIQTKFLCVRPLPKTVLHCHDYEKLYSFTHFNGVQSQVFHCCYNTDNNVLLGAPTGSGKTIVAELCILRLFTKSPHLKVVYIAPMKALVRERVADWREKFASISKRVIEVTGDVTPSSAHIANAHIIVTTPEKWDSISRNWMQRTFVRTVGLIVIDEIHLLAEERGPILEIIVSRMNHINNTSNNNSGVKEMMRPVRIIGLSTAMANAGDLANWLGINNTAGLYNFSSSVRPVPLEIHLQGFPAKNYCPRMATMNRPAYQAICQYAPVSPTLIFVSSRKQTRITGYELIKCMLADNGGATMSTSMWVRNIEQTELDEIRSQISDTDLAYLLTFGVGVHHAGLRESDRCVVERLFVEQKIQVLIATATLAWGVNFPAHLVIVKGTEYFDGATKRYVDMPVTDVLQMMGRAGRPQFDTSGVACVFVHQPKKAFYTKFLFEPFPVESNLLAVLLEYANAEISSQTVTCRTQLIDLICSTFFFRRLLANPAYYAMDVDTQSPAEYLRELTDSVIDRLLEHGCVKVNRQFENQDLYESTFLGQIGCQYYLSCKTVHQLDLTLTSTSSINELISILCDADEYKLFPVRHNEDKINKRLVTELDLDASLRKKYEHDSPHLKVLLLVTLYLRNTPMPNQEYVIDLKSVLDQILRILQAAITMAAYKSWQHCTLKLIHIGQMLVQGGFSDLQTLPHFDDGVIEKLVQSNLVTGSNDNDINLATLCLKKNRIGIERFLSEHFNQQKVDEILKVIKQLPLLSIKLEFSSECVGKIRTKMMIDDSYIEVNQNGVTSDCLNITFSIKKENNINNRFDRGVYSKRFGKQKDEGWFLLMVNAARDDLLRMQRFTLTGAKKVIETQISVGKFGGTYAAYILSDSYLGLDQKFVFKVSPKDL